MGTNHRLQASKNVFVHVSVARPLKVSRTPQIVTGKYYYSYFSDKKWAAMADPAAMSPSPMIYAIQVHVCQIMSNYLTRIYVHVIHVWI